jgi:hypothetical protein
VTDVRKSWLIGAVAVGALAATFVAASLARTFAQLQAFASATAELSRSPPHSSSPRFSDFGENNPVPAHGPAVTSEGAYVAEPVTGAAAPLVLGYRAPERRAGFDADAMRAAVEAEPSIGELINDPDPKVRAAILAFFEND